MIAKCVAAELALEYLRLDLVKSNRFYFFIVSSGQNIIFKQGSAYFAALWLFHSNS